MVTTRRKKIELLYAFLEDEQSCRVPKFPWVAPLSEPINFCLENGGLDCTMSGDLRQVDNLCSD